MLLHIEKVENKNLNMLQVKYIISNREEVIERLKIRNVDYTKIIDKIIELYKRKNVLQIELDNLRKEKNFLSKKHRPVV